MHSTIVTQPAAESDQKALQLPSAKGRMMNYMIKLLIWIPCSFRQRNAGLGRTFYRL